MSLAVKKQPVAQSRPDRVRVTEIFHSIQGETSRTGLPTVFVRLTGCPLRCQYCDTAYAFHGGSLMSLDEVLGVVAGFEPQYVTVTGGEPLAQKNSTELLRHLCDAGYSVSLETSGAMDVSDVDPRVARILDIKTPGSGEVERNRWENLQQLKASDQLKFVICDRDDYDWARAVIKEHGLTHELTHELNKGCEILFSPSHGQLPADALADWILADRLPVRLQLQMHKYIWGDVPGK
jgi:7-carboxy-7-deazaguanine synthase